MGKFDGKQIRGLIGNVVIKNGKKGSIIQSAPIRVRHTSATKTAQKVFGQGSVLAGIIRFGFRNMINGNYGGEMVNRFNAPVRDVLKNCFDKKTETYTFQEDSFKRLEGFEFNSKSLMINSLAVPSQVGLEGTVLKINLPEIALPKDLKFPGSTNVCQLSVEVFGIALHLSHFIDYPAQVLDIAKNQQTVPPHEFLFEIPEGCLCVVAMKLSYFQLSKDLKIPYNNKTFNPVAVCAAVISSGTLVLPPAFTTVGNRTRRTPWHFESKLELPVISSLT